MAGEPAFFELGVQDDEKGRAFYSDLFGWDFRPGPNEGYEIGTAGLPGGIHGGDKGAAPSRSSGLSSSAARCSAWSSRAMRTSRPRPAASSSAATTRARRSACTSARSRAPRAG